MSPDTYALYALAALLTIESSEVGPAARFSRVVSPAPGATQTPPPARLDQPSLPRTAADLLVEASRLAGAAKHDESRQRFEEALVRARASGDRESEALALLGIGKIHSWNVRRPEARQALTDALRLFTALGDDRRQGWVHDALAGLEWTEDTQAARREYELALAAYVRAGDVASQASVLVSLAYTAVSSSKTAAMDYAERGLALAISSGNVSAEGNARHVAGDLLFGAGDYTAALDHLEQAAACFERSGVPSGLARVYVSLGRLHRAHGRYDLALDSHRRALRIQEAVGQWDGVIQSTNAIAVALGNLERYDESRTQYERALELAERSGSLRLIAYQRAQLASADVRTGNYRRAIDILERGLATSSQSSDRVNFNLNLSAAYSGVHEYDRAWQAANEAEQIARAQALTEALPDALTARAIAERGLGRLDKAWSDTREALDLFERLRARAVPIDTLKQGFDKPYDWTFSVGIDVLHRLGRDREALETAERARARAFVDLLAARGAMAASRPATRLIDATTDLPSAASTPPLTAAELTALAGRLRSTLVVYWVDDDRTLIWTVNPDGAIHAAETRVTRKQLAELVGRTWGSAPPPGVGTAGSVRGEEWQAELRGTSLTALGRSSKKVWRDLHDALITPVRRFLPAAPDSLLTIVPHGPLFGLSFSALLGADGRYLIETYRLHVAPAGATLKYTPPLKAAALRPTRYLFVADPTGLPRVDDVSLPRLAGTTAEVRAIARRLPAGAVTVLTREDATEERVRALAGEQTVLHFATHGVLRDDAHQSFLALGATGRKAATDGRLSVTDIYDLRLKADLVVMSACRTARGRVSGDGVLGLTRAFFYAGTPSIVATLWDVADEPGSRLMPAFYRHLEKSADKSRALRAAQLELLKALRAGAVKVKTPAGAVALPEHPFFWASYILVGEP